MLWLTARHRETLITEGTRTSSLAAVAATLEMAASMLVAPSLTPDANAAPTWSSVPATFPCRQSSNACVAHTGFDPRTSYWGQDTNPRGNCTNYVAYRVQKNGGVRLGGRGNAWTWRGA